MGSNKTTESSQVITPNRLKRVPKLWTWSRLDDISKGIFDCPHSTPRKTDVGPLMARTQDILSGIFRADQAVHVSEKTYQSRISRAAPIYGDLFYSREGTYFGIAAEVPKGCKVCLGQRMVLIRPSNNVVTPFLRYWLNSPIMSSHIHGYRDGTVAERLNMSTIRSLPVLVPPLPEQRAIAHVLGSLDDKIELNQRMNKTLEQMAQVLFQSWFVDFDPVIDKALAAGNPIPEPLQEKAARRQAFGEKRKPLPSEIADLFPDRFVDSELGPIPEGWEAGTLGDQFTLQRGKTYKSKLKGLPGPYLLGLASIARNGGFRSDKLVTYGGDSPEQLRVYPGDLYVSLKDVTQSADLLGSVARVPNSISVGRMTQDTVKLVFDDSSVSRNIIYRALLTKQYRSYCRSHATGTTNLGLSRDDFLSYSLNVPTPDIQLCFDTCLDNYEAQIDNNSRQIQSLLKLRDTLLPKLISGELRIPDVK